MPQSAPAFRRGPVQIEVDIERRTAINNAGKVFLSEMTPHTAIIFNPTAGGERAREKLDQINSVASSEIQLFPTSDCTDVVRLTQEVVAKGFTTIVAAGGDGTVNGVVNGIVHSGKLASIRLGVLPIGTMNVFAIELGIPTNGFSPAWEIIRGGHTTNVDIASANGRHFVQLAGVGLDAQAVANVSGFWKKLLGPVSYIIAAVRLIGQSPPRLRLDTPDGEHVEGSLILIGNGRYYGGRVSVFKKASLSDGKLDVLVFKKLGHLDVVRYLRNIFLGTHLEMEDLRFLRVEAFTVSAIRPEEQEMIPFEVDGELCGTVPVSFSILPQQIQVLTRKRRSRRAEKMHRFREMSSQPESKSTPQFVFHDTRGMRWPRTRRVVALALLLLFVVGTLFTQTLFIAPQLHLPLELKYLRTQLKALQKSLPATSTPRSWIRYEKFGEAEKRRAALVSQQANTKAATPNGQIRLGYYAAWDPNSADSLAAHAGKLSHVCADWFTIVGPQPAIAEEVDPQLRQLLTAVKTLKFMPTLSNLVDDVRQPEIVHALVHGSEEIQSAFIHNLKTRLADLKASGVSSTGKDWIRRTLMISRCFSKGLRRHYINPIWSSGCKSG